MVKHKVLLDWLKPKFAGNSATKINRSKNPLNSLNSKKGGLFSLPTSALILLLLSFLLVACGNNEAGASIPPRTENINIGGVGGRSANINFDIPSGELTLKGLAASQSSVVGTLEYNSEALKPVIEENSNNYQLSQKPKDQKLPSPLLNKWNVQIGKESPLGVNVQLGNGNFNFAVGDIKLAKLTAKTGNGDLSITFDQAITDLGLIDLNVNNGKITLNNLPNAAPENFNVKVGSGSISLDFTGNALRRSIVGSVGIGSGNVNLILPTGVGARIECTVTTGNCNLAGFKRVGNTNYFENEFFVKGGNTITLRVGVSNGNLESITR